MKKYNIKEQLEKDVKAICFNRGRIAGSKGSEKSREYLLGRMREIELVPYSSQKEIYIPYNPGDGNRFHNLVGVLKGKNPELSPVLIGAHYDSLLEAECADDNAAAVAIALSAAEALQSKNLDRDVVVALFDAEEPPYFLGASMGSTRFFEDATDKRGFNAAVIMDLVGHDVPMTAPLPGNIPETIKRLLFITGAESAPGLADIVSNTEIPNGLGIMAALNKYVGDMSDHHTFRENRVPYLFLSCGRWQHYHRSTDTIDKLNFNKMSLICEFLIKISAEIASTEMQRSKIDVDTLKFEIGTIESALGQYYESLLGYIGLARLETRNDLEKFVDGLKGKFNL